MLYCRNKTTEALPLDISSFATAAFEGDAYNAIETAHTSYLQAADSTGLYSSFGNTKFNDVWIDNTDHPSMTVLEDVEINLTTYEIPALLKGVIGIDL